MKKNISTNELNNRNEKILKKSFGVKSILRIEVIIIFILLLFVIVFNIIPNKIKFNIKYNIEKIFLSNIEKKNSYYNYEEIENLITQNTYIKENEKELIKNLLIDEINENKEFINLKKIKNRIENLQISYNYFSNSNLNYKYNSYNNVAGDYNSFFNKIVLYDDEKEFNKNLDEISLENKNIYFHELNHLLTDYTISSASDKLARKIEKDDSILLNMKLFNKFYKDINIIGKNIFTETINELFTREYLSNLENSNIGLKTGKAYKEYMPYTYVLAEILDEETLKKYKFNDNESIIISGLLDIDDNFNEVYNLISSINLINSEKNKYSNEELDILYKKLYKSYSYFYNKKYNKNFSDDFIILAYFYDTKIQSKEDRAKLRKILELEKDDEIIDIIPKGYVSEKYKQEFKDVIIEYTKSGEKHFFYITEENRYI